jgi:hypothetical protein
MPKTVMRMTVRGNCLADRHTISERVNASLLHSKTCGKRYDDLPGT